MDLRTRCSALSCLDFMRTRCTASNCLDFMRKKKERYILTSSKAKFGPWDNWFTTKEYLRELDALHRLLCFSQRTPYSEFSVLLPLACQKELAAESSLLFSFSLHPLSKLNTYYQHISLLSLSGSLAIKAFTHFYLLKSHFCFYHY